MTTPINTEELRADRETAHPHEPDIQKEIDRIKNLFVRHEGDSEDVPSYANHVVRLRAENAALKAKLAAAQSCSSMKPKEFDLVKRTEWARLAHEAWGYLHTCRQEHHGTDLEGRLHAMNGLKEMSRILRETMPEALRADGETEGSDG